MSLVISPRFPVGLGSCQFTSPLDLEVVNALLGGGEKPRPGNRQLTAPRVPAVLTGQRVWEPCPAVRAFLSSLFVSPAHLRLCCSSTSGGQAVSQGAPHPNGHSWSWALPAGAACPEPTELVTKPAWSHCPRHDWFSFMC